MVFRRRGLALIENLTSPYGGALNRISRVRIPTWRPCVKRSRRDPFGANIRQAQTRAGELVEAQP
jgi:hypothetical protein